MVLKLPLAQISDLMLTGDCNVMRESFIAIRSSMSFLIFVKSVPLLFDVWLVLGEECAESSRRIFSAGDPSAIFASGVLPLFCERRKQICRKRLPVPCTELYVMRFEQILQKTKLCLILFWYTMRKTSPSQA